MSVQLLTSIYNIQANETEIAQNMLSIVEEYQQYYKNVSDKFDTWVPELRERITSSKKTRIYGVDLARHIRFDIFKIEYFIIEIIICQAWEMKAKCWLSQYNWAATSYLITSELKDFLGQYRRLLLLKVWLLSNLISESVLQKWRKRRWRPQ